MVSHHLAEADGGQTHPSHQQRMDGGEVLAAVAEVEVVAYLLVTVAVKMAPLETAVDGVGAAVAVVAAAAEVKAAPCPPQLPTVEGTKCSRVPFVTGASGTSMSCRIMREPTQERSRSSARSVIKGM